jgi:hypothetical protein
MFEKLHAKKSVLVRKKSMSTTPYFGYAALGGSGIEGYVLGLLRGLGAACVLGRGVGALVGQLLHSATSISSSARASACSMHSTHLTSQLNACSIDEPTVMTPFGPGIFILS